MYNLLIEFSDFYFKNCYKIILWSYKGVMYYKEILIMLHSCSKLGLVNVSVGLNNDMINNDMVLIMI